MATILYPLPYYIYTGGGTINVKDKIHIENKETKGDFNLCYVEQINANIAGVVVNKTQTTKRGKYSNYYE